MHAFLAENYSYKNHVGPSFVKLSEDTVVVKIWLEIRFLAVSPP